MRRMMCIFLSLAMLLSITACGGKTQTAATTETVMETTAAATTEPATEPTLSHEEQLLASLPERTRQAYERGLVELEQLEDLEAAVTIGEAAEMLQRAYVHRTGGESKTLNELIQTPAYADLTADRGWVFAVPGLVDMELTYGENYEDLQQWMQFLNDKNSSNDLNDLYWSFDERLNMNAVWIDEETDSYYYSTFDYNQPIADWDVLYEQMYQMGVTPTVYGPDVPTSYTNVYNYALKLYDKTNRKRFFTFEDGYIHPQRALTVADAVEYALVLYNAPNPMAYPRFVAMEDVGAYNAEIIPADLLEKTTDLPAPSCQELPKQWHGVGMDSWHQTEVHYFHLDEEIYEYEIQAMKEAGFNFLGLKLDFSWLQDYMLYNDGKNAFQNLAREEDRGKLSLDRLEKLDQLLAWCMKYDIHLNIRASSIGSMDGKGYMYREMENN